MRNALRKYLQTAVSSARHSPFWKEQSGAIAVYVGGAMMMLISAAGLYVDLSDTTMVRNEYQEALDNALVAAARKDDKDRIERAQNVFLANLSTLAKESLANENPQISLSSDGKYIQGTAQGNVPQYFRFIFGHSTMAVNAASTVAIASAQRRQADFVFVIDATGSMQNTINAVKNNALSFETNFNRYLSDHGYDPLEGMRIRVVFFQDYLAEGNGHPGTACGTAPLAGAPLNPSPFYNMPADRTAFQAFVAAQNACGGGDLAEYGLVGLNEAMDSNWAKPGDLLAPAEASGEAKTDTNTIEVVYPIIVLWTDARSYPLPPDPRVMSPHTFLYPYPPASVIPDTYDEYNEKWNDAGVIDQANKMLITFVYDYSLNDPSSDSYNGTNGYYYTIRNWTSLEQGGSLTDGNTRMVELIANAVMKKMAMPSIVR